MNKISKSYLNSEGGKVYWLTINVVLNGLNAKNYDWLEETKIWTKGLDYFPKLSWEDFLLIARKYDFWSSFEKILFEE